MLSDGDEQQAAQQETRAECPILRTHRRFLLRQLEFTQQYAPMYRCRMAAQQERALAAIQATVAALDGGGGSGGGGSAWAPPSEVLRVLELRPSHPAFCVGVVFKQMKLLPKFLDEYQRELVRIDAGGDNDGDGGEEGGGADGDAMPPADGDDAAQGGEGVSGEGQDRAAADEHYSVCHPQDELILEDSSGRVTLQGLDATRLCTGVVIGIYGTLLAGGQVMVHRYAFASATARYVPRPLPAAAATGSPAGPHTPCYVAFVCGLSVGLPALAEGSGGGCGQPGSPAASTMTFVQHRALLELLVDFISGSTRDPALLEKSRHISRLVIGGNSIARTDELRLKKKVKLDPSDHVRLNDDRASAGVVTSARLMRELDGVLERLAATVEVELMPGDNDMSDAFQPQQPLHPVLLPNAARYSTLRLVSNPFEFTALVEGTAAKKEEGNEEGDGAQRVTTGMAATKAGGGSTDVRGVNVFVTSGQNVNDVARETRFETRLEAMGMILASGCACPTAPNTLFSYPFRDEDPFLFPRTPHCFVACDQPSYETAYVSLEELEAVSSSYLAKGDGGEARATLQKAECAGFPRTSAAAVSGVPGVRLVCVPSFERSGALVLVDVNSPSLETTRISFAVRGEAALPAR